MAVLGQGLDISTFKASQRLEAFTFCLIKNGSVNLPESSGSYADGITLDQYNQGQSSLVRYEGLAKVVCGAEISDAQFISTNEKGQAIPATATSSILAKALESGSVGQVIQIMITKVPQAPKAETKAK